MSPDLLAPIADFLATGLKHSDEPDAVKHLTTFGFTELEAQGLVREYLARYSTDLHASEHEIYSLIHRWAAKL